MQLSELGQCGENENAQSSKQWGDFNPGSLDYKSGILPLSYHAPQDDNETCTLYISVYKRNANVCLASVDTRCRYIRYELFTIQLLIMALLSSKITSHK